MPKLNINFEEFEKQHLKAIDTYGARVKSAYLSAINQIVKIAINVRPVADRPFAFSDFPRLEQDVDDILDNLSTEINVIVNEGTYHEWLSSNLKNDKISNLVLSNISLSNIRLNSYYQRNLDAYDAFQKRKIGGLGLSDRIFKSGAQFKQELEMAIDIGLIDGRSAAELSRDIRGYLNEPDKLFRRVRDKRGQLHLSKNALAYNPGQGVYRSSFKNAFRLARNEINMAYRAADWERWQQLDFVFGIQVSLSAAHPRYNYVEICESLAAIYPKWFKFIGWHPLCLCFAVPVLMSPEDFERSINGEKVGYSYVKNVPDEFTNWVSANTDRINNAKSTPYFIRDNYKDGKIANGLRH